MTFFNTFLGPIYGPKIHQNRDQIRGANGGPDGLFPRSIPRWAFLGPGVGFWCILKLSWGVCGALLGHPVAILGPSWALLGHPVAILGHSCSLFLGHPEAILGVVAGVPVLGASAVFS